MEPQIIVQETWELLKPILQKIDTKITVKTFTILSPNNYQAFSCNTKWATINTKFTIGIDVFTVTDVLPNEWIKFTGPTLTSLTIITLALPFLYHGTILAQSEDLNSIYDSSNKVPFIYLHEITKEDFDTDEESAIDRISECELYFMTEADFKGWDGDDHCRYSIRPMRNLAFGMIEALKVSGSVGLIHRFSMFDHAKWGVYLSNKGHTQKIFNDNLSGTQMRIAIPFRKNTSKCVC